MSASRRLLLTGIACLGVGAACFFIGTADRQFKELLISSVLLGLLGTLLGFIAIIAGIIGHRRPGSYGRERDVAAILGGIAVTGAGAVGTAISALIAAGPAIAPWGRPLRVRGALLHADLRPGADWAAGPVPDCSNLSEETRLALATLWHHDAQKEHASVPAFSRLAWLLTGLGAPAELLQRTHQAALEEIDHARRCFALAGGYAGAPQSVEPIPELLREGPGVAGDALLVVAIESLRDGCLIEDFNADVAARACERATDPAARELVEIIARDERSHAALAWSIVEWCLAVGGEPVRQALAAAAETLPTQGPRAYAEEEAGIVAAADPQALIAHGRVPADEWAPIYARRLAATRARVQQMLGTLRAAA